MEFIMLTLFVNGIPVLKLNGISEIPARQGEESWRVADEEGKTIASYQPGKSNPRRHAAKSIPDRLRIISV